MACLFFFPLLDPKSYYMDRRSAVENVQNRGLYFSYTCPRRPRVSRARLQSGISPFFAIKMFLQKKYGVKFFSEDPYSIKPLALLPFYRPSPNPFLPDPVEFSPELPSLHAGCKNVPVECKLPFIYKGNTSIHPPTFS